MIVEAPAALRSWHPHRVILPGLVSFGGIGAVNTCVDIVAFNALMGTLPAVAANASAYCAGMLVGWWLNRRYTFASGSNRPLGLGIFVIVNALGFALTTSAVYVTSVLDPGDRLSLNLIKIGGGTGVMVLKFGVLRWWVGSPWLR